MNTEICTIELPGDKNYAIVSPGRIAYGLNATKKEFKSLVAEEIRNYQQYHEESTESEEVESRNTVSIIPTMDCNLRCIYCYACGGDSKITISRKIMFTAIKKLLPQKDLLKINFVGGGEPLLDLTLISKVCEYAKSIYSSVEIGVVTNGTFDEQALAWLTANRVNVRISYDGEMHESQRPFSDGTSSKRIVEENIKQLCLHGIPVVVQCIIARNGVNTLKSTIDSVYAMGVKTIKFEPVLATSKSRATSEQEPYPKTYASALLDAIEYINFHNLDIAIDTGYFSEPSIGYYCGMPTANRIITPYGLITSCVEVVGADDSYFNPIIYGEVKENKVIIDKKKTNFLKNFHYRNQHGGCKICNLRLICHGGCPMANIWKGGLPIRKSVFTCSLEKFFIPRLLLKIAKNPSLAKIIIEDAVVDKL